MFRTNFLRSNCNMKEVFPLFVRAFWRSVLLLCNYDISDFMYPLKVAMSFCYGGCNSTQFSLQKETIKHYLD